MYSKNLREKIIKRYLTGDYSYRKLAYKFDVSLRYITQVIQYSKNTCEISKHKVKNPSQFKLNSIYETYLLDLIKENLSITLNEISDYFLDIHGLSLGKSSVDRKLKSLKITYKKSTTTTPRRIA